jgi:hypothetical protein
MNLIFQLALVCLVWPDNDRSSRSVEGAIEWGPSWRCLRSVDCITATNDGLPEKARFHHAYALLSLGHWNLFSNCAPLRKRA